MTGQRFGMLQLTSEPYRQGRYIYVDVLCDCGREKRVMWQNVRYGRTRACGCQRKGRLKHGMYGTSLYTLWACMIQRCINPNADNYRWYGGRGITVCLEWREDFVAFYDWAKDDYESTLELDRIDNDAEYSPQNCRWLTHQEQVIRRGLQCNNTTGYKGVTKGSKNRWIAVLAQRYLGSFKSPVEAALAYNKVAKEQYGDLAWLNPIPEDGDDE